MILRANCKINIGLNIIRRREDGYHELETLCYPIKGLYDTITLEQIKGREVEFLSKGRVVDCSIEDNLCVKAVRLMQSRYDIEGVRVTLDKRVPFGAGLGGGSADATEVIKGLNSLFSLNLDDETLIELAAQLGSDTALFVRNTPQLCMGRGEVLTASPLDLGHLWIVMVKPDIHISTRVAFSGVTPNPWQTPLSTLLEQPIASWQESVVNDFETSIFPHAPLLAQIKSQLLKSRAIYASMSGSGSTVYGLYESEALAQHALEFNLINASLVTLPLKLTR
ncbi:MAG: 4-(cytidine 5'-diphospho)-2-C-methyl-D-erythritol kinase [Rikenellaceae bacterium]